MTKAKIAISLPRDQIAPVHREVRVGRSFGFRLYCQGVGGAGETRVSAGTAAGLDRATWRASAKDVKWAERALEQRKG
jgi:hypothetical protein